jgi:hypothetical protein
MKTKELKQKLKKQGLLLGLTKISKKEEQIIEDELKRRLK